MVQQKFKHPPKLPTMVAEEVKRAIVNGTYKSAQQLPSEAELARAFGVSRTTLRQGISILEQEGIITRKHGLGTFIASKGSSLRNNINSNLALPISSKHLDGIRVHGIYECKNRLLMHIHVNSSYFLPRAK